MGLNIKNHETYELVRELAKLTGESMTETIRKAVSERLERMKRHKEKSLSSRLLAIGKKCAPRLKEPYCSMEHGDLLYGEDGLP